MFLKPKDIRSLADEIWNSTANIVEVDKWLSQKLKVGFNLNDLSICEILDEAKSKIDDYIKKKISNYKNRYLFPKYEFDDFLPNTLIVPSEIKEEPHLSFLRKVFPEIRAAIDKMDWRKLECAGKHLLEINGALEAGVTRATKEGGIDFYGLFDIPTQRIFLRNSKFRVVGQTKHRSTHLKVGEEEIKKFAKDYEDFRNKRGKAIEILPDWFVKIKTPVLGAIITNSEFTRDAKSYAKRESIILRDGEQITEDLIHSRRSHEWFYIGKDGSNIFNEEVFLHSFKV